MDLKHLLIIKAMNTQAIMLMIKNKVLVEWSIKMVMFIMDHLKMIKKMGPECKSIIMGKYIQGSGKMIRDMDLENKRKIMGMYIKDIFDLMINMDMQKHHIIMVEFK